MLVCIISKMIIKTRHRPIANPLRFPQTLHRDKSKSKSKLTASLQQRIVTAVKLTTGQKSLAGSRSRRGWNSRSQRMMGRCCRIPCWRPACCLPVKHSQLIVDALGTLMRLHRSRLLLLLRGQVPEYPVNGRYLRRDRDLRLGSIGFINSILLRKCYERYC